jgi:regulator of RNase E activity RraB
MKQRVGFVSNSSSSSFIIVGKAKDKAELINKFREEMNDWVEKVATRFEEWGTEEYDKRGNLKEIKISIMSDSDDKFESSLSRITNLETETLEMRSSYDH